MLEQEIQNLTVAIRDLIAAMNTAQPVAPQSAAPASVAAPEPAPVAQESTKRRGRPPKVPTAVVEQEDVAPSAAVEEPAPVEEDAFDEPEVVEEVVTVETIRAAIRDVIVAGGKEKEDVTRKHIIRILAKHNGAKTLPELSADVYPAVLADIRAIPV